MRGQIDLTAHQLGKAVVHNARRTKRTKMQKMPDATYRQLWRIADGAVRDAFANHPEYLTQKGQRDARQSIVKRVTGAFYGYAAQAARGRSANKAAADKADLTTGGGEPSLSTTGSWMPLRNGGIRAAVSRIAAHLFRRRP